jgi:hypothetical protein
VAFFIAAISIFYLPYLYKPTLMRTSLFVLFSFLQLHAAAQVKKATAETVVQRVTVFTSGAQVQRLSTVPLTQGRTEVVFSGLSNQLDPQSLQFKSLGATVSVKGSALATVTDGNGFFKLQNFPQGSVALISSVGYESKAVALRPGYFTVALKESENQLNEVVVVGYGTSGDASAEAPNAPTPRRKQEEIQTVSVATQYQPTATVYVIDEKYTLETDGKTATIGIKQFTIDAQYQYYAAPKIDPSAFLTANIVNWQEYDLQSGEASLYFEGTSIGKTYIDLATSGDTLSLALGKDNSIRIARKLVKEFSSKKFISSNRVETKQYQITVRNSKKVPVLLTIEDQFPVSTNKEIDVQDTNAPEAQVNRKQASPVGILRCRLPRIKRSALVTK